MIEASTPTYCANHPGVETSLRCNKCGKPICAKCAIRTPTGYRCKECVRGQLKIFDTALWYDYLLGFLTAAILGFLASLLATSHQRPEFHRLDPDRRRSAHRRNDHRRRGAPGDPQTPLTRTFHHHCRSRGGGRPAGHSFPVVQSGILLRSDFPGHLPFHRHTGRLHPPFGHSIDSHDNPC